VFGDGNTIAAILVASIGIWLFHSMILGGVTAAAFINQIVTIAKIVPILVFIGILLFTFKSDVFRANFYGGEDVPAASLFEQVRATMLVTVFVFLGIEGASVYSRYAKARKDVGTATILGFVGVTCLMVLVTLLPYGVLPRAAIAEMRQPSMATVLESVVGHWGSVFVSAGLIVSVLGAYLAWSLIAAEVLFTAAKTEAMPRLFATENGNKVPAAALWLTNSIVQQFVISTYWSRDAFALMLNLTSAMSLIPYLLVAAAFGVLLTRRGQTYERAAPERSRDLVIAVIATLYTAFLLYAGGMKFLLLSAVLYAPGTILCERGKTLFGAVEWLVFLIAAVRRGRRHSRPRHRLYQHLVAGEQHGQHPSGRIRGPLGGRPIAQGHGVRTRTCPPAADPEQLRCLAV